MGPTREKMTALRVLVLMPPPARSGSPTNAAFPTYAAFLRNTAGPRTLAPPQPDKSETSAGRGLALISIVRETIKCGFVSGHVYINQYFRYNLVNSFNSKRMLKQEKLNGTRERVIFRKMSLSPLGWLKSLG